MSILGVVYLCIEAATCSPETAIDKIEGKFKNQQQCAAALLLSAQLKTVLEPERLGEVTTFKGKCEEGEDV